ncbi:DeoR family transcriptional regulator [Patescibacteria group bacterium]|nr:DeoR family transcriptional regulator [Patescibacteria group bacterium]MBU1246617.1 DeoR family transcriptional regulator [Patescibacteria group bacterium]MBU1519128.1 DeoR family transcriptional regulator [Patescibacteria group bacterium]MBU1730368.1 DeoR family transcriptional regulator [Patescibacteria group bacterium]MBU1956355.1 DeoR family transcriptional regulator [Patescibacteria group bacterium]
MLKKDKTINNISTTRDDFYTNNDNKDIDFYYFFENKTEKLVTAIYMVTNFLSDREPMKWKFRETGLLLLNYSSTLNEKKEQSGTGSFSRILSLLNEMLSMLEIAYLAGFISGMNHAVLKREYFFIKKQIESKKENGRTNSNLTFPESFFTVPKNHPSLYGDENRKVDENILEKNNEKTIFNKTKQIDHRVQNFTARLENQPKNQHIKTQKSHLEVRPPSGQKDTKRQNDFIKDKRKQHILQLLKDNKELTIKDISLQVVGCSEKTIQRDLVSMLQNKVLKKTGERRWSRYSLA